MKYELEIEDVASIVIQDLSWMHDNLDDSTEKERKALRQVIRIYMTADEYKAWKKEHK